MKHNNLAIRLGGVLLGLVVLLAGFYLYKNVLADTTPTITSISPSSGLTTGNQDTIITGQNFDQMGDNSVPTTTNTWSVSGNLPRATEYMVPVSVGDYVYLYGPDSAIYRASTANPNSFADTGATLPYSVENARLIILGSKMYIFGAGSSQTNIITASVADPLTWTDTGKTVPGSVYATSLAVVGNALYMYGGLSAGGATTTIYKASLADPTSWGVVAGKTLPGTLWASSIAVIGSTIYLFGGSYDSGSHSTAAIYTASTADPTTWTTDAHTLPQAIRAATLFVVGNNMYLVGGLNYGTILSTIYTASTTNPTVWTNSGKTLPNGNSGAPGIIVNGYMYMFGGWITSSTNQIYRASVSTGTDYNNYPWQTDLPKPVTSITFGGTPTTNIEYFPGGTTLIATTPAHAAGTVDVVASDGLGTTATLAGGYTYTSYTGSITGLNTVGGAVMGGTPITLTGSGFTSSDTVTIGSLPCSLVVLTSTTITCNTPAQPVTGTQTITVKDSTNTTVGTAIYTYYDPYLLPGDDTRFVGRPISIH